MRDTYSFRWVRRYPSDPWSVATSRDGATSGCIADTSANPSTDVAHPLPPCDSETTPPQSLQRPKKTTKSRKAAGIWLINRKRRPRCSSGRVMPLGNLGSIQNAGVMGVATTSAKTKIKKVVLRLNSSGPQSADSSSTMHDNTKKWWLKPLHFKPDPLGGSGTLIIRPKLLWNKNLTRRQARLKALTVKGTVLDANTPPTPDTPPHTTTALKTPSTQPKLSPTAPKLTLSLKPLRSSPLHPFQPTNSSSPSQKAPVAPIRQVTFASMPRAMDPPVDSQPRSGERTSHSSCLEELELEPNISMQPPRPATSTSSDTTSAAKGNNQSIVRVNQDVSMEPALMMFTLRHLNAHILKRAERRLGGLKR